MLLNYPSITMSKLDELKEKFEGFLEEVKSKLPSKKKKDAEEEDFDDEFDEATGQVEVDPDALEEEDETGEETLVDADGGTQAEVEVDAEEDEEEEESEDDEDEKKKKQKSLIIKGVLGVVLLYLVYDTFMGGESNDGLPPPPANAVKKRNRPANAKKRRPRRNRQAKADQKNNKQEQAPKAAAKDTNKDTGVKKKVVEATAAPTPTVAPVKTPEPTPVPTPKVVATPAPEPTRAPTPEPKIEEPIEQPVKMDAQAIPPETPEKPMRKRLGEKVVKVENSLAMDEKVDEILTKSVKEQMKKVEKEQVDESGIDPNMTYVEPPNYRRVGRGLVYNCVGRHWACVDKFAYFQCRENTKWSKVNQKEPECVVSNVYASEKDCGVVQLHYINTNEPTDFCDGNSASESSEENAPKTKVVVP